MQKTEIKCFLLKAEDESLVLRKIQNHLCWASSALGKLTRQRERQGEGGLMGAEKEEINKGEREVGWFFNYTALARSKDTNFRCF